MPPHPTITAVVAALTATGCAPDGPGPAAQAFTECAAGTHITATITTDTATIANVGADRDPACTTELVDLLTEWGFGPSTISRIDGTRPTDGELTDTSGAGWTIWWTVHPDTGLDITAERD